MAYVYNIGIATVGPLAGFGALAGTPAPTDLYLSPLCKGGVGGFGCNEGAFNMPGVFRRSDGGAPGAKKIELADLVGGCVAELFSPGDPGYDVDKLLELYQSDNPQIEKDGVTISARVPKDLPIEYANCVDAQKAIRHILDNAIKYRDPAKAEKFVKIYWEDGCLIIEDNGLGIKDVAGVLQGQREHSGIIGTGLGLLSIQDSISKLGWTLAVESEVGKYTKFRITPRNAPFTDSAAKDDAYPGRVIEQPKGFAALSGPAREFINDLVTIFGLKSNPSLEEEGVKEVLSPHDFPLTMAVFERAIACKMGETGKKRENIIVCVPGSANNAIEVLN